jgi:hypothetical protein
MVDEQEIPGASNGVEDAPPLEASRRPQRQVRPTQKLADSSFTNTKTPKS